MKKPWIKEQALSTEAMLQTDDEGFATYACNLERRLRYAERLLELSISSNHWDDKIKQYLKAAKEDDK